MKPVVLFDLPGTLCSLWFVGNGSEQPEIDFYEPVREILAALRAEARLGVLLMDPLLARHQVESLLRQAGALDLLDPSLLLVPETPDASDLDWAIEAAGLREAPENGIYVGSDRGFRKRALDGGLRTVPHPGFVRSALDDQELRYFRAEPREDLRASRASERGADLLPADLVDRTSIVPTLLLNEPGPVSYGITTETGMEAMRADGLSVRQLGSPACVATSDLFLLRVPEETPGDDGELVEFRRRLSERAVHEKTPMGDIVALSADDGPLDFHPPQSPHGQALALTPCLTSLSVPDRVASPSAKLRRPTDEEAAEFARLDGEMFRRLIEPWYGRVPLADGTRIESRNVYHAHNRKTVTALVAALEQICGNGNVRTHVFSWRGRRLMNVQAELPGNGDSDEIVVVGAHLDSTASGEAHWEASRDRAPGADDDASGIAGVLAAAELLQSLSKRTAPRRGLRFTLFNAEEEGMLGSGVYSSDLKQAGRRVVAMIQMDMIGWLHDPSRSDVYELHGGGSQDRPWLYRDLVELSEFIASAGKLVSPELGKPELYPLNGSKHDPAVGSSDHSSFQRERYPACLVAEDWWHQSRDERSQTRPHPTYHKLSDTCVDVRYAASIARVVAFAAWLLST